MPIAPGVWMMNPPPKHSSRPSRRNRKRTRTRNVRKLLIRHNSGGNVKRRRSRRRKSNRARSRRRSNVTRTLYAANRPRRRRRRSNVSSRKRNYRRRPRSYRRKRHSNPRHYVARRRSNRRHHRRRNQGVIGRTTGIARGLFTMQRAEQVGSALLGYGGTDFVEQLLPIPATSQMAVWGKKVLAATITYMVASFVIKNRANRQALALGAVLNVTVDALKQYVPELAARTGFSGYGAEAAALPSPALPMPGYRADMPSRLIPQTAYPSLAN